MTFAIREWRIGAAQNDTEIKELIHNTKCGDFKKWIKGI
jgi:hypothetical protein